MNQHHVMKTVRVRIIKILTAIMQGKTSLLEFNVLVVFFFPSNKRFLEVFLWILEEVLLLVVMIV